MQVQLVMFRSDGQRREFTIRNQVTTIGRATECDFQIPLAMVSRKHCQITVREDHVSIRDLGSSNGTFVNDVRVQEGDLEAGDKLVIGPVTFTVVIDGQPADLEAVAAGANGGGAFQLDDEPTDQGEARQTAPPRRGPAAPAAASSGDDVMSLEEVEEVSEVEEVEPAGAAGAPMDLDAPAEPAVVPELTSPVEDVADVEAVEDVEEVENVEEVKGEAPEPQDPLAALEAMTRPTNRPK